MAMHLSIDEEDQRGKLVEQDGPHGPATVWIFAQLAAMMSRIGRAAGQAIVRMRRAQAQGSKRRQMKLVESLQLGNRRQLLLVVCDNQRYLVGAGADNVGSILAVEAGAASRDRAARGPELVRRRGRDANQDARSRAAAEAGPDLWD